MLITRKTRIPTHWVFYAQIPFVMWIGSTMIAGAPFLFALKKFIDDPAAITFLLSIEVFVTVLGSPFTSWLSDRVWTRFGRRKIFVVIGSLPQAASLVLIPFAPNLMWLLAFRWAFGLFSDLAAPNQALTMEVVPPKQRGLGAGFFQMQLNLLNIVFWYLVFGRLDDVAFTGPLTGITSLSGEVLVFASGALLLVSSCFYTFFGIHEVQPPNRKTLADERKPGESVIKLFLRAFFRDVLSKALLPLYLLLLVQTLAGLDLGILGPLLYTDQWGFTKQQMGGNIAIGAIFGIFISILAGWIADRTSKMKVYAAALVIALLAKCAWTLYVYQKPGFQPSLFEIIVFSNIQMVFSTLAAVTSFPLILEYVERDRLGTAGAGMSLFSGIVRNGFTMLVGFYVLGWSLLFLPQAGEKVEIVFNERLQEHSVIAPLATAGLDLEAYDFHPIHRPGVSDAASRHWSIRRSREGSGEVHSTIKDLTNQIEALKLKRESPLSSPRKRTELTQQIDTLSAARDALRKDLESSASAFEARMRAIYDDRLPSDGQHILDARLSPDGTEVALSLEIVEPVSDNENEMQTELIPALHTALDTLDIERRTTADPTISQPALAIKSVSEPRNALVLTLKRDPDFVALENAFVDHGIDLHGAYNLICELISPIRETFGQHTDAYRIHSPSLTSGDILKLDFHLEIGPSAAAHSLNPHHVKALFERANLIKSTSVSGAYPNYHLRFDLHELPHSNFQPDGITEQLQALLPNSSDRQICVLQHLYHRIEDSLASSPFYLHTAKPVIVAEATDREYDYFFSMQLFMIITDLLGIGLIALIIRLQNKGVIRPRGVEEDRYREQLAEGPS